jgi:peptide/nickel transport system permease protein
MAIGTSTGLGSAPADGASLLPVPDAAGRRMRLQLPRSPKVLIGLAMLAVFLIVAVIGPWIAPYNPSRSFSATASFPQAPSAAHWLGTTQQQQDVLSQLLAGGRSTVLVAFVAGLVATVLSIVIGVTAGYAGRLTDDLLSMLANFFLVLPALPLLIVIFGFLKTAQGGHDLLIGLVIAITGWAWGARVLRAQTLSLRNRDYVESARIVGERGWRIIGFEILPNLTPIVASSFLFTVLYGVGTYTALAFLGLVNPNHWSWGGMLFYAQVAGAEQSGYWWLFIPPGIAVALLGTSLALINFGIDEFINPRLRVAGLSRRRARRAGVSGLPKRFVLGVTPVVRQDLAAAADGTPGWGPGGRAPGGRAPGGRAPGGRAPGGPAPGAGSADLISASGHAKSRRWRRGGGQ